MLKFIQRLFTNQMTDKDMISELINLSNGLGDFANMEPLSLPIIQKGNQLLQKIEHIERQAQDARNDEVYYWLAIAYRNYTAWYKRGEERKFYLEKTVDYLRLSIEVNANLKAKEELATILLNEKQVRNSKEAQTILDDLKQSDKASNPAPFLNEKAQRLNGEELHRNFLDFKSIDPLPAFFSERRKRYRQSVRDYKKNLITKKVLEEILKEFYNMAILYSALYKEHDANSAVAGIEYEKACKKVQTIGSKLNFNYTENGRILNGGYLSENDWKAFELIFGKNENTIDAFKYFKN